MKIPFTCMITFAAVVCGGSLMLSGCTSKEATGIVLAAPHAAPPVQVQMQSIANNPHIPAAQKAALENQIAANSKLAAVPKSGFVH